jgi:hypothetical protein
MDNQHSNPFQAESLAAKISKLSSGDFRSSVLESVTKAIPGTLTKWTITADAERKAMKTVTDGVRTACEISVALSSSKEEADKHITKAEEALMSENPAAIGMYLQERVEAIDTAVSRQERNGWTEVSSDARKFITGNFGDLCAKLDGTSRDQGLKDHCAGLRKDLFPKVVGSEYKRDSARGPLHYAGEKGVGDFLLSSTGKSSTGKQLNQDILTAGMLLRTGTVVPNIRREDSPNVCQR